MLRIITGPETLRETLMRLSLRQVVQQVGLEELLRVLLDLLV